MKATIAATQMALAGVRYFLLTTCSHFEPGSAPSRLKANSIREFEVIELRPQKAWAITKPANNMRPPVEPKAFLTMSSTGLVLAAVAFRSGIASVRASRLKKPKTNDQKTEFTIPQGARFAGFTVSSVTCAEASYPVNVHCASRRPTKKA